MSKFASAMYASALTANGALSYSSPDPSRISSGRISLFFKSCRGLNIPRLYQYLSESSVEEIIDTFIISFNTRDCRGGKGEKELGKKSLQWLMINYPNKFIKIIPFIPEYGRWDDLLHFFPGILNLENIDLVRANYSSPDLKEDNIKIAKLAQTEVIKFFVSRIYLDIDNMIKGGVVSLAAKWAPTENDSLDRKYSLVSILCKEMNITPREYRKNVIGPLRSYINIVEKYMCDGQWSKIDYSKVPSCAIKRLKKAFDKHDHIRFMKWKELLFYGKTTVKAKQLHPHELVAEVLSKHCSDEVTEAQWKVLEDMVIASGVMEKTIVVCDTSGSMIGIPMNVSLAFGIIISNAVKGVFHNHVITFSEIPSFFLLKDGTFFSRVKELASCHSGYSTDFQAVFTLILSRAKEFGLKNEDMPDRLIVISDMQFNSADNKYVTNHENIKKKYKIAGYNLPSIVYWNVNGSSTDFPVTKSENNTALLSGFSPSLIKSVLSDKDIDPYNVLRNVLDDKRYENVKISLS
jgi:hypothetical protein